MVRTGSSGRREAHIDTRLSVVSMEVGNSPSKKRLGTREREMTMQ